VTQVTRRRVRAVVVPQEPQPVRWWRRIRVRWALLAVVVVAGVSVLAGWLVWSSPLAAVTTVQVVGGDAALRARVETAAAVPVGTPLARLDVEAVTRRVASLPQVASAVVTRSWPHTVTVSVVPVQPVATVRRDGAFVLVGAAGDVYASVTRRPTDLPLVTTGQPGAAGPGLQAALSVAGVLASDAPSLLRQVTIIDAHASDALSLQLRNGTQVVWGSAVGSATKASVVQLLRGTDPRASQYDVSAPQTPSVRP
jgi:cell division septal protein FtsQ